MFVRVEDIYWYAAERDWDKIFFSNDHLLY